MKFGNILNEMAAIHEAKNADYGNSFELSARLLNQPIVVGLLHRMTDKLARACHLAGGADPQVKDEALRDSLLDLANYSVLAILALDGHKQGVSQARDGVL
ncbi:MAG: nucleotide modification associated domain-containing protein [Desulfobacca sp.]|nr:nucleotide modification associated domain-containing protein [Desulfobacca sp.]